MFPMVQGVTAGAGLGLEAAGAYMQYNAQTGIQNAQQGIIAGQKEIQQQNYNSMQLQSRRAQLEVVRNAQRARSTALSNAVGSGSQFGSGVKGGFGNIQGEAGENLLGINQNEAIGKNIFQATQGIDTAESSLSKAQGQAATGQGIASLGSNLVGGSQAAGNLFG